MIPNYHYEDMVNLHEKYVAKGFANPALVVDCNHSNSNKNIWNKLELQKKSCITVNIQRT